jgi:hypothetical protein
MEISVDKKLTKLDNNIKLRDIANKLTLIVYGETLVKCLGRAMQIRKGKIKESCINLNIPRDVWENADYVDVCYDYYNEHTRRSTLQDYIKNIANHCKKHGITVNIVLV